MRASLTCEPQNMMKNTLIVCKQTEVKQFSKTSHCWEIWFWYHETKSRLINERESEREKEEERERESTGLNNGEKNPLSFYLNVEKPKKWGISPK